MARRSPKSPQRRGDISPARMAMINDGIPLAILALALFYARRLFTIAEHEAQILIAASRPVRTILVQFWSQRGPQDHPPLYDLWLHLWLRLSGGAFVWLRAPSIVFFLVGIFFLSRASRRVGGTQAGNLVLWLAALWPLGFHYGSLVVWYSC